MSVLMSRIRSFNDLAICATCTDCRHTTPYIISPTNLLPTFGNFLQSIPENPSICPFNLLAICVRFIPDLQVVVPFSLPTSSTSGGPFFHQKASPIFPQKSAPHTCDFRLSPCYQTVASPPHPFLGKLLRKRRTQSGPFPKRIRGACVPFD